MIDRSEKFLGGLLGGAIGDAMGAATEIRTREQILEYFGGYVTDLETPPEDTYAHGKVRGFVTDDFSVSYFTGLEYLKANAITKEATESGLKIWYETEVYSKGFAGPTTRLALASLLNLPVTTTKYDKLLCENRKATNGAPMKSGIIGLFDAGDLDKTINDTFTMCQITHNNTIALSAAASISVATAKAMEDNVDYTDVIKAGIWGAREAYNRAKLVARPVAGPSVEKRTQLAVELGMKYQGDFEKAIIEINDIIGCGLKAYEAAPAAFGFIAAAKGDALTAIQMAVNAGDDTDTVAIMVGYIVGALKGINAFPPHMLDLIQKANGFDIVGSAAAIEKFNREGR